MHVMARAFKLKFSKDDECVILIWHFTLFKGIVDPKMKNSVIVYKVLFKKVGSVIFKRHLFDQKYSKISILLNIVIIQSNRFNIF